MKWIIYSSRVQILYATKSQGCWHGWVEILPREALSRQMLTGNIDGVTWRLGPGSARMEVHWMQKEGTGGEEWRIPKDTSVCSASDINIFVYLTDNSHYLRAKLGPASPILSLKLVYKCKKSMYKMRINLQNYVSPHLNVIIEINRQKRNSLVTNEKKTIKNEQ